jgi:four helix bundle protein
LDNWSVGKEGNEMIRERKNINRGYRKLRVWQRAMDLAVLVYKVTRTFPKTDYRLVNQMTGAASSVHGNIAEGYCRRSLKEYLNFLNIALGSLGELGSYLVECVKTSRITEDTYEELDKLHYEVENLLIGLIKSLERKRGKGDWRTSFIEE